jgi:hypothetical protein
MTRKLPITGLLPSPGTKRWVARRKAAVVAAVSCGQITLEEACRLYQLSEEEFLSWQRAFETHGVSGLRATCLQRYRGDRSSRLARTALPPATDKRQESSTAVEEGLQGSLARDISAPKDLSQGHRLSRPKGHFREDLKLKPHSLPMENR